MRKLNKIFLISFILTAIANAGTPERTIDCKGIENPDEVYRIELYRTGHPMGGLYSYGGLVFYKRYVFMTKFTDLEPLVLSGQAGDIDHTLFTFELTLDHLSKNVELPAKLTTRIEYPLGRVHEEKISLVCRGH